MSVTQEQIEKLSKNLSKIYTNNTKLWDNINSILEYIELLNEVDTKWVTPTISVVEKFNTLRKDEKRESKPDTKSLLECSNAKVIGNWIAISNIMK